MIRQTADILFATGMAYVVCLIIPIKRQSFLNFIQTPGVEPPIKIKAVDIIKLTGADTKERCPTCVHFLMELSVQLATAMKMEVTVCKLKLLFKTEL